jgi:2-methylisocitrate lyase-like PEP mutase family enzyme
MAAVDAKKDEDFIVIARTDALSAAGGGFAEALKRGKAYARAGADMVFCEFPSPEPEMPARFARELHEEFPGLPLFFNYSSSFKWHESPLTFADVAKMGYKVIIVSLGCVRSGMQAVWDYATDLMTQKEAAEKGFEKRLAGHPTEDFHRFAGVPRIREIESRYLPGDTIRKKYED